MKGVRNVGIKHLRILEEHLDNLIQIRDRLVKDFPTKVGEIALISDQILKVYRELKQLNDFMKGYDNERITVYADCITDTKPIE